MPDGWSGGGKPTWGWIIPVLLVIAVLVFVFQSIGSK